MMNEQNNQKKLPQSDINLSRAYNNLLPMMQVIFSSEARPRYATDKSLFPLMMDLIQANQLTQSLINHHFNDSTQAETFIKNFISVFQRKDTVLNYTTNAFVISDNLVFKMLYKHGIMYHPLSSLLIIHPLKMDPQTSQRAIAFLKRFERKSFKMDNPEYSKYYESWVKESPCGAAYERKRQIYTTALQNIHQEIGVRFRKISLPSTNLGKTFIKEISHERD